MSEVQLLARTIVENSAFDVLPNNWIEEVRDCDYLAEFAGRECYQSWSRPNPATRENVDYLNNVIEQGHLSVLAHASFTFRFVGVSRSLTHELIRHRFLAFSELSQRYVNMEGSSTVVPPLFADDMESQSVIFHNNADAIERYDQLVERAIAKGATRKEARQASRCVLPGGTATNIVVSGNVRAWRDFVVQRNTKHADAEIREVAREVLRVISEYAPNSVADLVESLDG